MQIMKYHKIAELYHAGKGVKYLAASFMWYRPCIWNFPFCTLPHPPTPPPLQKKELNQY